MATISRFHAVVKVGGLELAGLWAWILWLAVHVVYVVGFRSRLSTLMSWTWTFLGSWRGQMTVTDQQVVARNVMELVLLDRGEDDDDTVVARAKLTPGTRTVRPISWPR